MSHSLQRLGIIVLASLALMSFRLEPQAVEGDRLLYDVRGASSLPDRTSPRN